MVQSIKDMLQDAGYAPDPVTADPRRGWLIGASFAFCGTNWACGGPRLAQWLSLFMANDNATLVNDGEPGDDAADMQAQAQKQIDADTGAGVLDQLIDFALLEFTSEAIIDAIGGVGGATISTSEATLGIMKPKTKTLYALRYPPYTADMDIPYFEFLGLTPEDWANWITEYDTMIADNNIKLLDAHYDWVPSGRYVPALAPYPDYHISSQSAYRAAQRIADWVRQDYA